MASPSRICSHVILLPERFETAEHGLHYLLELHGALENHSSLPRYQQPAYEDSVGRF
jgi:hypothetical protein